MTRSTRPIAWLAPALSALSVGFASAAAQETPCGQLLNVGQPAPGQTTSTGLVSANGSILAGQTFTTAGPRALRWTEPSGFEILAVPTGFDGATAEAIDAAGDTVVGTASGSASNSGRPYRWDEGTGSQPLNWPFTDSSTWGQALLVSDSGLVVAGELWIDLTGNGEFANQALVWTGAGAPTIVSHPAFQYSRAIALSADGATLAGIAFDIDYTPFGSPFIDTQQAFVWSSAAGFTLIGSPDDGFEPVDLSSNGQVLLGNKPLEAHIWTAAGGLQSVAPGYGRDLSADGTTLVGNTNASGVLRAFRWTASTGIEVFGAPAGGRSVASFVSTDGSVVVGTTRNASFEEAVFRWTELTGWEDIALSVVSDPFLPQGISADASVIAGRTRFGSTSGMRWEAMVAGQQFCLATLNSTGYAGALRACGCDLVSENDLVLVASRLPANTFGFFVNSRVQSAPTALMNSVGTLCLGAPIGRHVGPGEIFNTGAPGGDGTGSASLTLNLNQMPTPQGFVSVQVGETWNFQAWYRDSGIGTSPSNLTEAASVTFF